MARRSWSSPTSIRLRQAEMALKGLKPGARVLEVGCGAGQFIRAIKHYHPELACTGTDISREAIALARQTYDGVAYEVSEPYTLPFDNERFEAVLIFDVLEHVDDPLRFMQEVSRVLVPGGTLYAFVPCEGDSLSLWHYLTKLRITPRLTEQYAGHIQAFSRTSLAQLMNEAGFQKKHARYSEHLLGQIIGVVSFIATDRAAKARAAQHINNEEYFLTSKLQQRSPVVVLKQFINTLIFYESFFLQWIPSPNVHVVYTKTK